MQYKVYYLVLISLPERIAMNTLKQAQLQNYQMDFSSDWFQRNIWNGSSQKPYLEPTGHGGLQQYKFHSYTTNDKEYTSRKSKVSVRG